MERLLQPSRPPCPAGVATETGESNQMTRTQVRRDAVKSVSKIEANRRNARASTGPRTAAGKARAAQNARRHGLNLPARLRSRSAQARSSRWRARSPAPMPGRNASSSRPGSPPRRSTSSGRGARASTSIRGRCASATRSRGSRPSTATRGAHCRCASARCATSTMRADRAGPGTLGGISAERSQQAQGAQEPGQRRPRRGRRVLQALRKVDLPVGWPGGCTDPVDDSGIAPSHATSPWALRQNEANRKCRARHGKLAAE